MLIIFKSKSKNLFVNTLHKNTLHYYKKGFYYAYELWPMNIMLIYNKYKFNNFYSILMYF